MKWFSLALLAAFAAAAFASQAWKPGTSYVYDYKSRTMTGIPSLKTQLSGLGLRSKVTIQVKSASELLVQMSDIGVARAENQVFPEAWNNMRRELPLSYSPLESNQGLSRPFKVNLREGQVENIETTEDEPVWSVNIKRALASQLSLNVLKIQQKHRYITRNEISKDAEQFYTVDEEPSVTGECKTYYTIVPLPEYIAKSEERDLSRALKDKSEERPAYIITKTKDFTFCRQKPAFIHSSTVDEQEDGSSPSDSQHKRFNSRTSVSRYLIRGEPMQKFSVERVWTEGELVVRPFATNTESIIIASNQTLVLKQEEQQRAQISEPSNLVRKSLVFELTSRNSANEMYEPNSKDDEASSWEYEQERRNQDSKRRNQEPRSWEYEQERRNHDSKRRNQEPRSWEYEQERSNYPHDEEERHSERRSSHQEMRRISPDSPNYPQLTKAPRMDAMSGERSIPAQKVQEQIQELLAKIEESLESMNDISQKEPQLKVLQISRALKVLSTEEIEEVYRKIASSEHNSMQKQTKRSIFLDAVAMAGTNPCVMFLKEKIQKREIKGEKAAQLIMVLPATVKTPTPELLRELVHLAKAAKSFPNQQVWYTSLLAVSTLINRACIDPMSRRHNWAVSPADERPYCTPKEAGLIIPYLKEQIYQTHDASKMIVLVQAIGNLGAYESYSLLRPIVTGKYAAEKQVRAKAIFALSRIAENASRSLRQQISSTLKPIFASPAESTEVRLSAFVVLLKCRPSEAFFTEAATGTWFEPSQQVAQFVRSSLEALSNCTFPAHRNISRMATMALPLAKKVDLGIQYSRHAIFSHVIPERRIGSSFQWAQFSGKRSLIPENMYMSLKNYMGGFEVPLFEGSIQSQGVQTLINRLFGPEQRQELPSDSQIHTRKDLPPQVNFWMKFMGNMERVFTVDTLREWAMEGFIEYKGGKQYSVNYQKALPLQDIIMLFPVDSGLPIYVAKKTPLFISIRGTVEVDLDMKRASFRRMEFPRDAKLKLNLKPIISMSRLIEAGVASPLTKEIFLAGHKTNVLVTLPGKLEVIYRNQEIEFIAEREQNLPSKVELLAIKSVPYTAQTAYYNFLNKNIKNIEVRKELNEKKAEYFHRSLGLALEADVKMDNTLLDFAGFYNLLRPHTFLSASQFITIPHTLKHMEYNIKLDLSRSETKSLRAKVSYSSAKKAFSVRDIEEEEKLERTYYKHKPSRFFNEFSEKCQQFFDSPESQYPELGSDKNYRNSAIRSAEQRRRISQESAPEELSTLKRESQSKVRSVHMEVTLEGEAPRRYRSSAVHSRSADRTHHKISFLVERESAGSYQSTWFLRANAQIKYPKLPVARREIHETPMTALGHFMVKYGSPEKTSTASSRVVLSQTTEWRNAVENSDAARQCSRHEQEGSPYSVACKQVRREAQSMNKIVMDIESQNTPKALRNMTHHFDDFFKASLYPYMSNSRLEVENKDNKLSLVIRVQPVTSNRHYQILDVKMYKPSENTFFQGFKMSPIAEAFLPISAEYSTWTKAFGELMQYQYSPSCEISREHVTTFDNVTYRYPLSDCYYLLAKDCSKKIPVEILAKEDSEGKKVKINLGKLTVEILPERKVLVNGEKVDVELYEEKVFKNSEDRRVVVISRPKPNKVVVSAPLHGAHVLSDGKHIQVQMSNMFRGRTCGLCGDMNSEKTAELKDPKGCIRNNVQDFAQSYHVGSCPNKSSRSYEAKDCVREYSSTNSAAQAQESRRSSSGLRYVNKVVPREGETCFSVKPVPECSVGTQPTKHVTKEVGFHCVRSGRTANEMIARSRSQVLEELFGKSADFTEYVAVPESCKDIQAEAY